MLFTCPSRYSFTIGYTGVFSLGGWSPQLRARLLVTGGTQELHHRKSIVFGYRAFTVSGAPFQATSPDFAFGSCGSYNPRVTRTLVWAWPVSLAATPGISVDFSSSRYLDVSVPSVCPACAVTALRQPGCPIRPSRDQCVCAAPPSLSQLTTAFIASVYPGILHMLSLA